MFFLTMIPILCVATGGAIGALLRFAAVQVAMRLNPSSFPLGTMLVNILGSFAIGYLMARYLTPPHSEQSQLFFVTGILGGFTTFSAFSWDTLQLVQRGALLQAGLYVGGSVMVAFAATILGYKLGQ